MIRGVVLIGIIGYASYKLISFISSNSSPAPKRRNLTDNKKK